MTMLIHSFYILCLINYYFIGCYYYERCESVVVSNAYSQDNIYGGFAER
jgi:hypothetical protein